MRTCDVDFVLRGAARSHVDVVTAERVEYQPGGASDAASGTLILHDLSSLDNRNRLRVAGAALT